MICVDASVAAKWILDEEMSGRADALYVVARRSGSPIVAPSLLLFEVTNIIRQQMRKADALPFVAADRALDDFLALQIEFRSPPGLHQLALTIADAYDLPAAYDTESG